MKTLFYCKECKEETLIEWDENDERDKESLENDNFWGCPTCGKCFTKQEIIKNLKFFKGKKNRLKQKELKK